MKVNVTGFTPAHQNTKMSNRKRIIQVPLLLMEAIKDAGHEVDYNVEDADINIIYLFTLGSINSGGLKECFDLIRKDPSKVVLSIDDWRVKHIYEGMEKVIATKKFSKTHPSVRYEDVINNLDIMQDIIDGKFPTLIPANKHGDHSLLGVRGDFKVYDPSIYVERERMEFDHPYDLFPIHASLAADHKYLDKRKYSYIQVQNEKEDKVWELYNKHRIVMSPPYYHNGSGWWRNRYTLANLAHAVIIEDIGGVFGPEYEVERKKVTDETIDEIYEKQNEVFHEMIMSREDNAEVINELFSSLKT